MRTWMLGLSTSILLCSFPTSALAMGCEAWGRLDPAGKSATVRQMIDARVNGEAPKKYNIPKPKIERCLLGHEQNIIYSFDDVCSDPSTGGMGAIEKRLTDWVMTCVNS